MNKFSAIDHQRITISLLWHALCWDIFLSQSDLNFLSQDFFFNIVFVKACRVFKSIFEPIWRQLLFKWLYFFEVNLYVHQRLPSKCMCPKFLTHYSLKHTICCDLFCNQSKVNFLSFDDIAFFSLNSQTHFRPRFISNFSSQIFLYNVGIYSGDW